MPRSRCARTASLLREVYQAWLLVQRPCVLISNLYARDADSAVLTEVPSVEFTCSRSRWKRQYAPLLSRGHRFGGLARAREPRIAIRTAIRAAHEHPKASHIFLHLASPQTSRRQVRGRRPRGSGPPPHPRRLT
ncbi:hypothetical protein PsYK624_045650 [Phanerochaete sordida]|uniref:Uncharacterized protein n=1 Tax=Phanerochaete sordida TaxID=48140 RepID=A0A9P3LC39_9APHY|nr:hypothetical protein PsYK624_045650 [Phanerochaete sordida]